MTHKTGVRPAVMVRLNKALIVAILKSKATMGETKEALHDIDMMLFKKSMQPWENETCPTCPKDVLKGRTPAKPKVKRKPKRSYPSKPDGDIGAF